MSRLLTYLNSVWWASHVGSSSAKSSETCWDELCLQGRWKYLTLGGRSLLASCHLQAFTYCSLSWCRDSLHLLCHCAGLLTQRKNGSPAGLHFFSLLAPFIPHRNLYTHQFPLSFSHTHSATQSQQDGCLFNPKPVMESAYCLWSTYSRWVNISQLRPLFFFPPWLQPE